MVPQQSCTQALYLRDKPNEIKSAQIQPSIAPMTIRHAPRMPIASPSKEVELFSMRKFRSLSINDDREANSMHVVGESLFWFTRRPKEVYQKLI